MTIGEIQALVHTLFDGARLQFLAETRLEGSTLTLREFLEPEITRLVLYGFDAGMEEERTREQKRQLNWLQLLAHLDHLSAEVAEACHEQAAESMRSRCLNVVDTIDGLLQDLGFKPDDSRLLQVRESRRDLPRKLAHSLNLLGMDKDASWDELWKRMSDLHQSKLEWECHKQEDCGNEAYYQNLYEAARDLVAKAKSNEGGWQVRDIDYRSLAEAFVTTHMKTKVK